MSLAAGYRDKFQATTFGMDGKHPPQKKGSNLYCMANFFYHRSCYTHHHLLLSRLKMQAW
jgi:hypothetical protein